MSSILKGIVDEAEAFDYDSLAAMPGKEKQEYFRNNPEIKNLYYAEQKKRIDAQLYNYSWMTPEEKAQYEKLAAADDTSLGVQSKSFSAEKYLKQLFQKKMDAKKAASMFKIHWAPLKDLQKYLSGQISPKTELSAYLAKSPEDLGKVRWGAGTIGIVVDGHITIGGRGDLGSDQYKTVDGARGQQKYASRPGQIDPTFDTLDLGKHHEVLVDNWKIREIVLPSDIPENVDAVIKKAGIPVRRLANQEQSVDEEQLDENLRKWFKEKWVRFGPDGKIRGACARGSDKEGKPKCLPQKKAQNLGKKGRKYAASKKRREDPNPERRGKAKNVATKKNEDIQVNEKWSKKYKDSINCSNPKGFSQKAHCAGKKKNESMHEETKKCPECGGPMYHESMMTEKQDACYHKVKSRYKVWPSAYASGALVQCRKKGAKNWGTGGKKNESNIMKGIVDEARAKQYVKPYNSPQTGEQIGWVSSDGYHKKYWQMFAKDSAIKHAKLNPAEVDEGIKDNIKKAALGLGTAAALAASPAQAKTTDVPNAPVAAQQAQQPAVFKEKLHTTSKAAKKYGLSDLYNDIFSPGQDEETLLKNIKKIHDGRPAELGEKVGSLELIPSDRNDADYIARVNYQNGRLDIYLQKGGMLKSVLVPSLNNVPTGKKKKYIMLWANWTVGTPQEKKPMDFEEDYTGEFAAEVTSETNPYGGLKDRQHRGMIGETPTDNPTGASGEGGWRKYKPKPAGEIEEDTAYAGGMGQGGNAGESYRKFKPKSAGTFKEDEQLDELKCWSGYTRVKGVPAGAPGSCKKKTKESAIMKGLKR
jgi:hypothetical protein